MEPTQLGPYRIGKRLGRGGMGAVYEGVNLESGQAAAIKVLNPQLATEEGFRERFAVEIETLKKLRHPNIVRLYGYGEQDGRLYYAMELIEGTTLEHEIEHGRRYDWRETTHLAIKLCKALKIAHDHGIIHRDIKPANLLLTKEGDVKLTDFGIARLFGNTRLTSEGGLIGTAEYMAPEQADGRTVTHHCDLYSLGGVMFTMLTGRPPFRAKSLPEMLQLQRFAEPPTVRQFAPDVPAEMDQIVARLLAKDPQARYPNPMLLAKQLASMEYGLSVRPREGETTTPGEAAAIASSPTVPDSSQAFDALGPTRLAESESPDFSLSPEAAGPSISANEVSQPLAARGATLPVRQPTVGQHDRTTSGPDDPEPHPHPTQLAASRFITVEEDDLLRAETEDSRRGPLIAQVAVLLASLIGLAAIIWYATRPPTADELIRRIDEAVADANPAQFIEAEADMASFLLRFPDDPRTARVREYQEEVELAKLERRFQRRAQLLTRDDTLAPIQRDYLEAMNLLRIDPQAGLQRLQAIVDLYDNPDRQSHTAVQMLELVRRQLTKAQAQVDRHAPEMLQSIDAGLMRAQGVQDSDPQQARAIWQAIVTLYGDKPWAASRVQRARDALATYPRASQ